MFGLKSSMFSDAMQPIISGAGKYKNLYRGASASQGGGFAGGMFGAKTVGSAMANGIMGNKVARQGVIGAAAGLGYSGLTGDDHGMRDSFIGGVGGSLGGMGMRGIKWQRAAANNKLLDMIKEIHY